MPHHDWDDETFDWGSLNKAINQGTWLMNKLGRVGVHSKEKYGNARWSLYLFDGTLHSLTHPGYVYSQYPKWLWIFDIRYRPLRFLIPPIIAYQSLIIKLTFAYLVNKFPHIVPEILSDAPRELLFKSHAKISGKLWKTWCKSCGNEYTRDNDKCPKCGQ